jgi:hypothetical protein
MTFDPTDMLRETPLRALTLLALLSCNLAFGVSIAMTQGEGFQGSQTPTNEASSSGSSPSVNPGDGRPGATEPIAKVGDVTLTREDLWDWVRANPHYLSTFGSAWGQTLALAGLIQDQLLGDAALEAFPSEANQPKAVAKRRAVTQFKKTRLTPAEGSATPEALREHYEEHRDRFGIPPMIRVRELFFPAIDGTSLSAARTEAASVHAKIAAGAAMESFAQRFAPDYPSQRKGGDRGYRALTQRPELERVTASMEIGDISEPIQLPTGFAIIQLLGRREAVPADYKDVKDAVRSHFLMSEQRSLEREFYRAEGKKREVSILVPEYEQAWTDEAIFSREEGL